MTRGTRSIGLYISLSGTSLGSTGFWASSVTDQYYTTQRFGNFRVSIIR
jgi:hypothetical protein